MPCRRPAPAFVGILLVAACASGSLRDAKNAYNRGDFAAARSSAARLRDDPQARLIAARAGARMILEGRRVDSAALAAVAVDLRAAARGYPFPEEWANRELAAGFADWLMRAGLPELAELYYRAGLEAAGGDPEPAEQALSEGALQAGLESIDRWEPEPREREGRLRDLGRLAERALDDSGLPYPPGLADQALRVAWHDGRFRDAWRVGAAGWLRATTMDDPAPGAVLASRLEDLVFPAWRDDDGAAVEVVEEDWRRAMRSWKGTGPLAGPGPGKAREAGSLRGPAAPSGP